jgi:hypothetical protein
VLFLEKGQSAPGCTELTGIWEAANITFRTRGVGNWTAIEWSREKGVTDPDFICITGRKTMKMRRPRTAVNVEPGGWGKRILTANNLEVLEVAQLFVLSTDQFDTASYRLVKGD